MESNVSHGGVKRLNRCLKSRWPLMMVRDKKLEAVRLTTRLAPLLTAPNVG